MADSVGSNVEYVVEGSWYVVDDGWYIVSGFEIYLDIDVEYVDGVYAFIDV